MQDEKEKIDKIIREADDFRMGDYLGKGFELFQKDVGGSVVFTLIFLIISMVVGFIPIAGSLANSLVISPAMMAGIYLVGRRLDRGESTEFGQYFKGFEFTGQLLLGALVTSIFMLAAVIPFVMAIWDPAWIDWYQEVLQNPGQPPTDMPDLPPMWSFLLLLPAMFLSTVYTFVGHFIIFHGLGFWPAMEASRRLLSKHFLMFFLFGVVLLLIMTASLLLFCIGILAGIPIVCFALYAAFADLTKLNASPEATAGEGIERHLVD